MSEFHFEKCLLPEGWSEDVAVSVGDDGRILSVEPNSTRNAAAETVSGVVLPGIPNLHSHAFQRAAAGLTERRHTAAGDSFWTWREVMHGFVTRLAPDDAEAVAAALYVEMLKVGYTGVAEFHYLHLDPGGNAYADAAEMSVRMIRAAETAGIALTLLPVLYSIGGYGGREPNDGQRRYILDLDDFLAMIADLKARFEGGQGPRIGIAPHSVRQVPGDVLCRCIEGFTAMDGTAPIHIHSAEQVADVEAHVEHAGARPVRWLLDNIDVDRRWCLVHATHLDDGEVNGLAGSGAIAGLCPTTEANLGDGLFPLVPYLKAGGVIGIGSDSHISVSPVEELRWLEYGQRLITLARNVAAPGEGGSTGRRLLAEVLAGGAQAMGQPMGELTTGARADWIVLDTDHPQLYGRDGDALVDSFIFSGNANPVRHVAVGGHWVVRDGRHKREEETTAAYRETIRRLTA